MPRFYLIAAALALAAAPPLRAAEAVTRAQVLDAIRTFDSKAEGSLVGPSSAEDDGAALAAASNTILKFSLESDDVIVDLGSDSVPWCDVKKGITELSNSGERGLLLAAYLAGSVKAQLGSGKQDPNPYQGWVSMLRVYKAIRIREGVRIPEVENLLVLQMKGSLEQYASDAARRSAENLRRTYGPASVAQRPIVTASAQP
jgi:hypothetical protein